MATAPNGSAMSQAVARGESKNAPALADSRWRQNNVCRQNNVNVAPAVAANAITMSRQLWQPTP
eukprot:12933241-Prorocentrum_lima.AAC.1